MEVNCANKYISEVKGFEIYLTGENADPNKWTMTKEINVDEFQKKTGKRLRSREKV